MLLGTLRDATRIAHRLYCTALENHTPSHPVVTAPALTEHAPFASLGWVQWGRLSCASVHVMLRPRVKIGMTVSVAN